MRKKYKRSTKGYKETSPDKDNKANLIPSNYITMQGVGKKLIGAGLDENGKLKQIKFMKPDEEYDFKKSYEVLEMPKYQTGGSYYDDYYQNVMGGQQLPPQPLMPETESDIQITPEQIVSGQQQVPQTQSVNNLNSIFSVTNPVQDAYQDTTKQGLEDASAAARNKANNDLNNQPKNIQAPPKINFFNPYNGVDIPTAATTLGSSIESGNALGIAGSGLKLLTGLGRNIVGGIANQRANQYAADDYNEKQRDALTQYSYQKGGELTDKDVDSINNSIEGVDFTPETINSLFERVSAAKKPDTFVPNLGRYEDVGYFDVDKIENDTVILKTTDKNPYNPQTYKDVLPYLQEQNPGKKVDIRYIPRNLEEGGELKQEEILSGQYSGEDSLQPNAEIEKGEYLQDNQGQVTEIKGDTHEQGGVEVNLKENERVLSDHTKIGKDAAKMFKKDFELNLKAKDTYATVLDRFGTKSGLKKLYKEQEELIKKVEKETEKEDSATKQINMEFLSKKINELEEKKKPLEDTKKLLFDKVYEIQESKKPKSEQQDTFQIGGEMYNMDQISEHAKQYGIETDRAKELIKQFQFGGRGVASGLPEGQSKDSETNLYGGITQQQLSDTMLRNPWFDWNDFDPANPQDIMKFQKEFNTRSVEGNQIKEDGKFGIQTQSVQLPFSSEDKVVLQDETLKAPLPNRQYSEPAVTPEQQEEAKKREALQAVLLPDQSPLPPSALQPVLKNQRRYGRIDPTLVDPTQELSEIDRQTLSATAAVNERPDASRNATLAQIAANSQNASSQTVSQANRANQQAQQKADAFNVRQGDREVDSAAADALSYEQRMFQGMSNTENDVRDYFQTLQNLQMTNFDTINELNYMNALNDKFQFDGSGFTQTGRPDTVEEQLNKVKLAQATNNKLKWGGKKRKY